MFRSLSGVFASPLGRRGILIVTIPLVFSIIFVVSLRFLFYEASLAADREARSKDIIAKANLFGGEMVQVGAAYYIARTTGSRESFLTKVNKIRKDFGELEALIPPRSKRGKLLAETRVNLESLFETLTTRWEKKYDRSGGLFGNSDGDEIKNKLQDLLILSVKAMNTVVSEENLERKRHPNNSAKYRAWIDLLLIAGVAINLALAVGLIAYFSNGITRRLLVVSDNSARLAEDRELNPAVSGKDEIAQLDRVFHEMAGKLTDARNNERKVLETLKLSEARFRSIIDTIPLGLIVIDSENKVRVLSPSAERLFGYGNDEFQGRSVSELLESSGRGAQAIPLGLKDFDSQSSIELQARRLDGSHFPAELLSTTYDTADMHGRLLIVTDISQRYEIDRLKQSFVSMVSHELRSPLMSIQMCLTMILKGFFGALSEEGVHSVHVADKSVLRLISLVNEILDVERLESGTISIDPKKVSLQSILELASGSVQALAIANSISIETSKCESTVFVDQNRIVQVLVNLLSNAIKFSPVNSKILIEVDETRGTHALVSVRDFGRGIPEDHLELIFNRFHQVSKSDATEKGGAGLGLAICKAIIDAHKGEISVGSKPGEGSCFSFTVPFTHEEFDDDED